MLRKIFISIAFFAFALAPALAARQGDDWQGITDDIENNNGGEKKVNRGKIRKSRARIDRREDFARLGIQIGK